MSSRKPSAKPSSKSGGTSVSRTAISGSSHRSGESSTLKSNLDAKMATRQLKYETLKGKELVEQEAWAQKQLEGTKCKMGYPFIREKGGYRCCTSRPGDGWHFVPDELVAEGKNRQYVLRKVFATEDLFGEKRNQHYESFNSEPFWANLKLADGTFWMGPFPTDELNPKEAKRMRTMGSDGKMSDFKGKKEDYPWVDKRVVAQEEENRRELTRPHSLYPSRTPLGGSLLSGTPFHDPYGRILYGGPPYGVGPPFPPRSPWN